MIYLAICIIAEVILITYGVEVHLRVKLRKELGSKNKNTSNSNSIPNSITSQVGSTEKEVIISDLVHEFYDDCSWKYGVQAVNFYFEKMKELPIIVSKDGKNYKDAVLLENGTPSGLKGKLIAEKRLYRQPIA